MVVRQLIPYLIVAGLILFISVCYFGYREYQKHIEFQSFISNVETTFDNHRNSAIQAAPRPQGIDPSPSASSVQYRIDVSNPPIQAGVISKAEEVEFELVDWSKIPPDLRAKWENFDPAPMTLQRIQTPNGKVHFIELPVDIDFSKVEIVVSEEMAKHSTLPPTGSFPDVISVDKADIPKGESVESYVYKKRWALFLGVSVEEVSKQVERGHLPPLPPITERTSIIEFPIEVLIGNDERAASGGGSGERQQAGTRRADATVADDVVNRVPVRSGASEGVEPVHQGIADLEKRLKPQGIEAELEGVVSPDHFDKARQLIDEYGTEEELRRLREMDPEAARQFERHPPQSPRKQGDGNRAVPDGGQSEPGSKD